MKPTARTAGLLLAAPAAAGLFLLAIPLILGAGGADTTPAGCQANGTQPTGTALDARQLQWAATIVDTAAGLGLPLYAANVALATALQESGLRMLANDGSSPQLTAEQAAVTATSLRYPHDGVGHDHDSVNLFQQRWTTGWGTIAQLMDPAYAIRAFYLRLLAVPGWSSMPLTEAAQAVQHSADGGAYARWAGEAAQLTGDLWPPAATVAGSPSPDACVAQTDASGRSVRHRVEAVTA